MTARGAGGPAVPPRLIVVTGTSRGLGLEFVRQLLAQGHAVIAVARTATPTSPLGQLVASHPNLGSIVLADVTDAAGVTQIKDAVAGRPLAAVIHNAGVWGGERQSVKAFDVRAATATYAVNALAPVVLTVALRTALREGKGKVVAVSSGLGSIAGNTTGGDLAYRMSKAALNMAMRGMAVDLRKDGIAVAAFNPGWVKTDMGGPSAPIAVRDAVRGMLRELAQLEVRRSGRFIEFGGRDTAW